MLIVVDICTDIAHTLTPVSIMHFIYGDIILIKVDKSANRNRVGIQNK